MPPDTYRLIPCPDCPQRKTPVCRDCQYEPYAHAAWPEEPLPEIPDDSAPVLLAWLLAYAFSLACWVVLIGLILRGVS